MQQSIDCRHTDTDRRDDDERAFDAAGEVLRLAVSVRVLVVGGARGDGEHRERHHGADQVDQRFHGVGEQADRSREQVRDRLQRDGEERGCNRQPREPPQETPVGHVAGKETHRDIVQA
jgi:hypothetical protein